MSGYIPFYTEIWADKKFRKLTPNKEDPNGHSKLIFIYLIGNPSIHLTGIYDLDLDECKVKLPIPDFDKNFREIIDSGMIMWDEAEERVFVINKFKRLYNQKSPTIREGVIRELNMLNSHPFKDMFLKIYAKELSGYTVLLDKDNNAAAESDMAMLNENQVRSFAYDLKWDRARIKKFYVMDRLFPEQKVDEILQKILPNLR